jgi:hypothetical protein
LPGSIRPPYSATAGGEVRTPARRLLVVRHHLLGVGIGPAVRRRILLVFLGAREVDAAADGLFLDGPDRKVRGEEAALDVRVVGDRGRRAEQLLVDPEMNRRLIVRGRHEDRLVRRDAGAEHGRRIQVREKDQDVVLIVIALEVLEQRGAPGALLPEPLDLVVARVRRGEDPLGIAVEGVDVALAGAREAADRDAADPVRPFGILVLPGDVVRRASRQDLHLVPGGEPLGDEPAVVLGSPKYLRAVALDDEGDFHI